jgi:hypothetical protein
MYSYLSAWSCSWIDDCMGRGGGGWCWYGMFVLEVLGGSGSGGGGGKIGRPVYWSTGGGGYGDEYSCCRPLKYVSANPVESCRPPNSVSPPPPPPAPKSSKMLNVDQSAE